MALLTHEKGKRSQRSLRPSSEVLKKGELMGLAKVPFRKVRKQHVVLTDRVLYWSGGGMFRREHGVIALKDILGVGPCAKKHAASGLELSSYQHPCQVFVARSGKDRDEWVAAIDLAMRAAQASDPHPTLPSHNHQTHTTHYKKQNSMRGKSRQAQVSPPSPPLPRVKQVTCESGAGEVVVWRGRDVNLLLQGLQRSHEVLVWVEGGAHARVGGATVGRAWPGETRVEVPLSDGSGSISLGFTQEEPAVPLSSVVPQRVAGLWAVTILACVLAPRWAAVMCLAYGLSMTWHELRQAQEALGRVRLTLHGFQARVKEVSVVAAGSDGPIQRPGRGAWEPGPTGIPPLFVSGCVGDLREARDKWEAAKQWRHDFQIDQVLERPHPLFDVLCKHWTLVALPNARNGDAVFLDRVGRLWMRMLTAEGINKEDVLHHLVFLMEFALVHLRADPSIHHQIFVYDLEGVSVRQLDRTSVSNLTAVARLYQQRYTGHDRAVLFINAPATFPIIWSVIGSFVRQTKRNNIHVAARGAPTLELLSRFLHPHDIPSDYGGGLQLPNGLDQDRHLLPNHAKLLTLIESLKAAHPHATTHMPVA